MIFRIETFLTIGSDDRTIFIKNNDASLPYTLNPFNIVGVYAVNNVLKVRCIADDSLSIPFSSSIEAKNALANLNIQIDNTIIKPINNNDKITEYQLLFILFFFIDKY